MISPNKASVPRIDGSSDAAYFASFEAVVESLSEEDRRRFLLSIYKIEAAACKASRPDSPSDLIDIGRRAIHGLSAAEILAREEVMTTGREKKEAAIEDKASTDYGSLSEPERVWYTVTRLLFCIRDGGVPSYFYNGYSEHVDDCLRSLEILREATMAAIVRKWNAHDWARLPSASERLKSRVDAWTGADRREGEQELALADAVETKLDEYATRHGLV